MENSNGESLTAAAEESGEKRAKSELRAFDDIFDRTDVSQNTSGDTDKDIGDHAPQHTASKLSRSILVDSY
jgi:hypothetical protein